MSSRESGRSSSWRTRKARSRMSSVSSEGRSSSSEESLDQSSESDDGPSQQYERVRPSASPRYRQERRDRTQSRGTKPAIDFGRTASVEAASVYSIDNDSMPQGEHHQKQITRSKGSVDWFWICQTDVVPGYVATPWQSLFSQSTCFGAIATMLEVLRFFTDGLTLRYVDKMPHCEQWAYAGRSTHPSYAINAMGGIIISRRYPRARFGSLQASIPPIELLRSKEHQLRWTPGFGDDPHTVIERLGEIMGLDSWLSFCGRLSEVCDGKNNLLRRMPSLIQKLMTDFEYEFQTLDRTASEGGFQIIQETADMIKRELERHNLSDGEQLFTAVAVLRTAKMALYIAHGPSTAKLRDILVHDVPVYLV